jgi:hypothetical protein
MKKKFMCYWSSDYELFENGTTRLDDESAFHKGRGYEDEDCAAILALDIGETWQSPYGGHLVTCVDAQQPDEHTRLDDILNGIKMESPSAIASAIVGIFEDQLIDYIDLLTATIKEIDDNHLY